jgi:hypothetical protein
MREDAMSNRSLLVLAVALVCVSIGCVERHPPWELRGRAPCADLEERVARDRAKIEELEPTGGRLDLLEWHRDDLRKAQHELDRCKRQNARAD